MSWEDRSFSCGMIAAGHQNLEGEAEEIPWHD